MGREWLYWVGGASTRRRRTSAGIINQDDTAATSPGCMCAVFHLFDLHHFNLPLNHQHSLTPYLQQEATASALKGVEAPRNSLELEEPPPAAVKVASKPAAIKDEEEDENLNFLQIKTRTSIGGSKSTTEECSVDSPAGTKTPSLVARLMGLDLLPESNSPSISSISKTKSQSKSINRCFYEDDINVGARSLPETPRISSARRSDVEYHHHRLSLQINKDNTTRPRSFQHQDENRSPGHYAKQIVKQVRESVSRRVVGLDITNTHETRRDQNLLKCSKKNTSTSSDTSNPSNHHQPRKEFSSALKKLSPQTCNHQAIRNKKEETFVRSPPANKLANLTENKSKKAPLSSELLYLSGPSILPVKKGPSPPATKLPQKQAQVSGSDALSSKRNTQLSSNKSRSYKQLPLQQPHQIFTVPENVLPDTSNGCATTSAAAAEYKSYIQKILKRAGIIDKLTPLTLGKWHTPSHPLDPSIFYYLELFHPAAPPSASVLSRRCNRKLIFQLVDELLVDILRPQLDYNPWITPAAANTADHFSLVDELCKKIESFPAANCRVLEDIDFLVDKDLRKAPLNLEEEGERLAREIEGEIVERLVSETVAVVVADGVRTGRQKGWMSRGVESIHVTRCH
ncbi:hypothetical protein C2S51_027408 [Perilla frutescens var. frutescens]|nr:hypothetical protein C2S51_027408 [Perilla frutescens var. frutescens]